MTQDQQRQHHGPQVVTVSGTSQYPGGGWGFKEIPGWWKPPRDEPNMQLVEGQQYLVNLTTKGNYKDIVTAEQVGPDTELPADTEGRFTPQGDFVAAPAGQPAATIADYQHDDLEAGPQRESFSSDPVRDSIEKQVFYKDFNPDAVLTLPEEEQAALTAAYFRTAMELVSTQAHAAAVRAYEAASEPSQEGARDAE